MEPGARKLIGGGTNLNPLEKTPLAAIVEAPPEPRRLSADLRELLLETAGRSMTLGELEDILKGRGFGLFLLLMALPFVFPIPLPGLSVPFGIVIVLVGLRIALGRKPSLPGFILARRIPQSVLEKTVSIGLKIATRLEKLVKPRMHFLQRWPGMINLIGLGIVSSGLLLSLPLPIPFSNSIPALGVLFLTAGLIERDGLLVLIGHFMNIAAWIYVSISSVVAGRGIHLLWERFSH